MRQFDDTARRGECEISTGTADRAKSGEFIIESFGAGLPEGRRIYGASPWQGSFGLCFFDLLA